MDIKLHKSCDTLPIYNFYKIVDTADLRYLVVGYDDFDEVKYELKSDECNINWSKILTEYGELTSSRNVLLNYEKQIEIKYLETRISSGEKILDIYAEFGDLEVLALLKEFDFSFDEKRDVENQINMAVRRIKGLRNKVRILKANYILRFGKKQKEEIKTNLVKSALSLELSLDIGREINVRTTSVSKWVYMVDISNNKAKEYEKIKNK